MKDLVRVEQVYGEDGEKMRIYSLITKQADDYLGELLDKEQEPVSQDRMNKLINEAAEKYPIIKE